MPRSLYARSVGHCGENRPASLLGRYLRGTGSIELSSLAAYRWDSRLTDALAVGERFVSSLFDQSVTQVGVDGTWLQFSGVVSCLFGQSVTLRTMLSPLHLDTRADGPRPRVRDAPAGLVRSLRVPPRVLTGSRGGHKRI